MSLVSAYKTSLRHFEFKRYSLAIRTLEEAIAQVNTTEYLLIDRKTEYPKQLVIDSLYNLGVYFKELAESSITPKQKQLGDEATEHLQHSLGYFRKALGLQMDHQNAITNIVSIYTILCHYNQDNLEFCVRSLQDALFYEPKNPTIHYNLGFIFQKLNKLELSVIHYKLSIELAKRSDARSKKTEVENKRLCINSYYGLACVYKGIKQWPEALFYALNALKLNLTDPDVNNQLGIVYTEMRRTDLAAKAYATALKHYKTAFISADREFLQAEIYLNMGQMYSYNGDTTKSIDCYNKSLEHAPKFLLPFQNKIMNLNYIFDNIDDKMYVLNQHKLINKLLDVDSKEYSFDKQYWASPKINIGLVSGDYADHPVSFFLRGFLNTFDRSKFNVICYSEAVIDPSKLPKDVPVRVIRNVPSKAVADIIHKQDNIHILIDLAGHTALNRLNVFAFKPAPVQVTYLGYPNTTGLKTMDYRITDAKCDNEHSQKYYTETLAYLPKCFLNYTPDADSIPIQSNPAPFTKHGYITFGCFNRLNKVTSSVVKAWKKLLSDIPDARLVLKTKALINDGVAKAFLQQFEPSVRSRIKIVDCTVSHSDHMREYDNIDIALDTFPYSGTTTSCEALAMGVPVLTLRDSATHFHAQNVTASILENSGLGEYVCQSVDDFSKISLKLKGNDRKFWSELKQNTKRAFLHGAVCDATAFTLDLQSLFETMVREASK